MIRIATALLVGALFNVQFTKATSDTSSASYRGCYRENRRYRHFSMSPGHYDVTSLTPADCQGVCGVWSKHYAGLTGGQFCFCANTLPEEPSESNLWCNMVCPGHPEVKCGGKDHVSVYKTALPIEGLALSTEDGNRIVELFMPVIFNISMRSVPNNTLFSMRYGANNGYTSQNGAGVESKQFGVPGEYDVVVKAENADGAAEEREAGVKILVHAPVRNATLLCPEFVATHEEFSCNVTVHQGTHMQALIDWYDPRSDHPSDKFPIADAVFKRAGRDVPNVVSGATSSDAYGHVYVMWDSEFLHDGFLHAIEGVAAETGLIEVYVMVPSCPEYCHQDRACGTCSTTYHTSSCASNDGFCAAQGECYHSAANQASCTAAHTDRYVNNGFLGYHTVETIEINLDGNASYFNHIVSSEEQIQVSAGSFLGYKPLDGKLATRPREDGEIQERVLPANTSGPSRHHLSAIYSRTSTALFYHEYREVGNRLVVVNISSNHTDEIVTATFSLEALEGINVTLIQSPSYAATNESVTFLLLPQSGNNVSHFWDFGDGTNTTTTEMLVNKTYRVRGEYSVSCVSSNSIGMKENTTSITIQDRLLNLQIVASPAPTNEPHPFNFSADSGSDYFCYWDMGDDPVSNYETNDTTTPVSGAQLRHTFTIASNYLVSINCSNEVSAEAYQVNVTAQDRITGLALVNTGALTGQPYAIVFELEEGTNPSFTLEADGQAYITTPVAAMRWKTNRSFTTTTVHIIPVTVRAWNLVSSQNLTENFTVEQMIEGPFSNATNTTWLDGAEMTVITEGDSVVFTAGVDAGTSVEIIWDWNDTTSDSYHYQGLASAWPTNQAVSRTHAFNMPGEFAVEVTIRNHFNSSQFTHIVRVYNPVQNITVHTNSPIAFLNDYAVVILWFTVEGDTPTAAEVAFDWDDDSETDVQDFAEGQRYQHTYTQAASFDVSVNVRNYINSVTYEHTVVTVEPVANMLLEVDPSHAAINTQTNVTISMEKGNDVTLSIDFGDNYTDADDAVWSRTARSPWETDIKYHTYTQAGNYNITVVAMNLLGNTTMQYQIVVQHPVTTNFTLSSTAPLRYSGSSEIVTLTLNYPCPMTLPDDAEMYWDYENGTASSVTSLPFTDVCPRSFAFNVTYDEPGDHRVTLVIRNLASQQYFTVTTGVYASITINSIITSWEPSNGASESGFGESSNRFPLKHDVILNVTATGTLVEYVVNAEHASLDQFTCTRNEPEIRLELNETGTWEVEVTARNSEFNDSMERVVIIEHAPHGMAVTDDDQVTDRNEAKVLIITFDDISSDTSVRIDWGDNSPASLYSNDSSVASRIGLSMAVSHVYRAHGNYMVKVNASNYMATEVQYLAFPVTSINCKRPRLEIRDIRRDFLDPAEIYKSLPIIITATVAISCEETLSNTKTWTVEKIDPNTGDPLEIISINELPSRTMSQLYVPLRFLQYGLYRFTLTVVMDPTKVAGFDFSRNISTYVLVVPSPLVALVANSGMGVITRGPDQDVVLTPYTYSRDPDIDPSQDQGITSFSWYCRQKDESEISSIRTVPKDEDTLNNLTEDNGGCFKDGPGIIAHSNGSDFTSGRLNFTTRNMHVNQTYEFNVTVGKDDRLSSTKLELKIIAGQPPVIEIDCSNTGFCTTTTTGLEANPSNRVALLARCNEQCEDVHYQWTMYRQGFSQSWIEVANFEEYVSGLNGRDSKEIAISPKLFADGYELYEHMDVYRVRLKAWQPRSAIGVAYTLLSLNKGPENGNCTITPHQGQVYVTTWVIHCNDWFDYDGISNYQFTAHFKDDDVEKQLENSVDPSIEVELPLGPHYNDYKMNITVKIFDKKGAFTEFFIREVKVEGLVAARASEYVEELLTTDQNNLTIAAAAGDLRTVNTAFLSIAAMLNSASQSDRATYGDFISDNILISDGYGPSFEHEYTYNNANQGNITQSTQQYEHARDQRSQLREQMLEATASMAINTVSDVQTLASLISQLTQGSEEVNRRSQEAALKSCENMIDLMGRAINSTSVEDLEIAASSIMSALGQTFMAASLGMNDPVITDIDRARDSEFYYYDTDYDSDRKALAEYSADDQKTQLGMETNSEVQTFTMDKMIPSAFSSMNRLLSLLSVSLVAGEETVSVVTPRLSASVHKQNAHAITNQTITEQDGYVNLPPWCDISPTADCNDTIPETISIVITSMYANPFAFVANAANVPDGSGLQGVTILDDHGHVVPIENTRVPIRISIPRKASQVSETLEEHDIPESSGLFYHCLNISTQQASVHVKLIPQDGRQYLVLGKMGDFPRIKGKDKGWDFMGLSPRNFTWSLNNEANMSEVDQYTVFADNMAINGHQGEICVGIRPLTSEEYDLYSDDYEPLVPADASDRLRASYKLSIFTSGCYYYNENDKKYETDGCTVKDLTTPNQTVCDCNHLTMFTGGFVVQPNSIDFDYVFANADFDKNPTIYVTQIVITVLYIAVAVWARRADKQDIKKLGITPLVDNDARDKYLYEIQVSTGSRKNAATDSRVHFILSGDYDETDVRTFEDGKRKIFRRGSTDNFLMAVPGPLGAIQFVRIWHDNSGRGKFQGWYCRYIVVHDIQTKEKFFFIVNNWFAVEEADGQIDRAVPVAGPENMVEFQHLFSQKTRKNLNDEHIWFSVVTRPPQSRFTRLERLTCCLCLLYTSMLANALFYERAPSGSGQNALVIGPFALTAEQLYVGFIANLVVFPVNFLVVTLFRKARPRKKRPSRITEALQRNGHQMPATGDSSNIDVTKRTNELSAHKESSPAQPLQPAHSLDGTLNVDTYSKSQSDIDKVMKKKRLSFPWWVKIVAWVILLLTVVVCASIVTAYGIQFGDVKSKKWITSMIISFLTSIFFTQPIKVFLVALLFSLIFKKADMEEDGDEDEEDITLAPDEQWIHQYPTKDSYIPPSRPQKFGYKPPDPEILAKARDYRMKEMKMYDILREILFYSFFLWILLVISYSFRDPNAFFLKRNLDNLLIDEGLGKVRKISTAWNDFRKINTYDHFYNWLKTILIPNLRAEQWYNGDLPIGQRGFIGDRYGRLMGYATMRQLRTKKGLCDVEKMVEKYISDLECNKPYSSWDEDTQDYGVGWIPVMRNASNIDTKPEYMYKRGSEIDTYPFWARHAVYSGGGYVVDLKGSKLDIEDKINEIMQDEWTDRWTRAIIIEFTVYNPNVDLFGVVTLVAEVLNSGGLSTYHRFEPMNLLGYYQKAAAFQIACEITYLFFILFFIIKEIRNMYKQRKEYFKQFWNWIELCIIVLSICCITIYFYRLHHANKLTGLFEESHGNAYMKFQYTGYWNELLLYFLGILCFLATIKFIRLLRFNRRMGMLAATLRYGAKPLCWFGIIFSIMFLAYAQFFYLIYFMEVQNFKTLIHSIETLLQMLVGKFNFSAMQAADPVMGPLIFFFYVVTVYYILLNMFLTILNESFARVREDINLQSNDYEMVEFIMARFKQWTGLKSILGMGKSEADELKRETTGNKLQKFPEKVDRLLDVLCRAYLNSGSFDDMFSSTMESKQAN